MARLIVWCVLGAAVTGVLSRLLGEGPERIRVLLVSPVVFGLLVGWGLAFTAKEFGVRSRGLVTVLSCLLVSGGLLMSAWEAYGELVSLARARVRDDSTRLLGLQLLEDRADRDPSLVKQYREQRMALAPRFEDYLMGRVSALGFWRSPWPAVFWVVELLLGTTAAGWLVWRLMGARPKPETVDEQAPQADAGVSES